MSNDFEERSAKMWDTFAKANPRLPTTGYQEDFFQNPETFDKKLSITQKYLQKHMEVLEYGCGTGATSMIHAPFVKHILAIDISGKMIEWARERLEESPEVVKNVEFQQVSINQLNLQGESKDVVFGFGILHYLKSHDEVIAKTYKWLKPGGLFFTSTACVGDSGASWFVKGITSVARWYGPIPYIDYGIKKEKLRESLIQHGFSIEYECQLTRRLVFFIAKKSA